MQCKYEEKYGEKFELLTQTFLTFSNLIHQLINIYDGILQQSIKSPSSASSITLNEEHNEQLKTIVHLTVITLNRFVEYLALVGSKVSVINYSFCEKFLKLFEENLSILWAYYHSLQHFPFIANKCKFENSKILEGIGKLYSINRKIR
jgi:hypothetical protein